MNTATTAWTTAPPWILLPTKLAGRGIGIWIRQPVKD